MTIEEALKAKIIALATPAADRIYRDIIEQEPTLPALAISRTGGAGTARDTNGVPMITMARITVGVVAWTTADATATADALKAGLDGWVGTQSTVVVLSCLLRSQHEMPEIDGDHKLRVVLQDYEIKFR